MMYGTIGVLHAKPGMDARLVEEVRAEAEEAVMPGYISQYLYRTDADPNVYYLVVMFADKDSYVANARHPEQHQRYLRLIELLEREPEWHDGEIAYPPGRDAGS